MMRGMCSRMPDLHLTIEDMVAEGDMVICRNQWRWTDPGSGKKMAFRGIAERWAVVTKPAEDS
jgi:predicted ester cyclase